MGKVDSPRETSRPDCLSRARTATQFSLMRSEDGCVAAAMCILVIDLSTAVNSMPVAPHCSWGWDPVTCSMVSMTLTIQSHFTLYWRKEESSCSALGLDIHPYPPLPLSLSLSSNPTTLALVVPKSLQLKPLSSAFHYPPHLTPALLLHWNINSLRAGLDSVSS